MIRLLVLISLLLPSLAGAASVKKFGSDAGAHVIEVVDSAGSTTGGIQEAIDSAIPDFNGAIAVVQLPCGETTITTPITLGTLNNTPSSGDQPGFVIQGCGASKPILLTNGARGGTTIIWDAAATDPDGDGLEAVFRINGVRHGHFRDFSVVGDEDNAGTGAADSAFIFRSDNTDAQISTRHLIENVWVHDFDGDAFLISGCQDGAGTLCSSDTYKGQSDQITFQHSGAAYANNCWNIEGDATQHIAIHNSECWAYSTNGILINGGTSVSISNMAGTAGQASTQHPTKAMSGDQYAGILITPAAKDSVISIDSNTRFENQIGNGLVVSGFCSEDTCVANADGGANPAQECTPCIHDDECSGTCSFTEVSNFALALNVSGSGFSIAAQGQHDAADSTTILTNSACGSGGCANFPSSWNGRTAYNVTDGSSCTITTVAATSLTCAVALTGGSDDTWQAGDNYHIGDRYPMYVNMGGSLHLGGTVLGISGSATSASSVEIQNDTGTQLSYVGPSRNYPGTVAMNVGTTDIYHPNMTGKQIVTNTGQTLSADDCQGHVHINTGASSNITIELPLATAGMECSFISNAATNLLRVEPNDVDDSKAGETGESFNDFDGITFTPDDGVQANGNGEGLHLYAAEDGVWTAMAFGGTGDWAVVVQ